MATIRDLIDVVGGDLDVEVTVPDPDVVYSDQVHPVEPRVSRVDDPSNRTVIVLDPFEEFLVLADVNPMR
jgi:hypothetical protein